MHLETINRWLKRIGLLLILVEYGDGTHSLHLRRGKKHWREVEANGGFCPSLQLRPRP